MSLHTKFRRGGTSVLRTRAAVLAAGLGASVALGAGIAVATDGPSHSSASHSASAVGASVTERPASHQTAAEARNEAAAKAKQAKVDAQQAAVKKARSWVTPVSSYTIGAHFGLAGSHWAHNHSGQDFVVPSGTSVRAAHGGTVVKAGGNGAGDGPAYGNAIVVRHDGHTYSQYAHLSRVNVRVGQTVTTGQEIGRSGSTGNSTGPHLHFEVRTTPNYGSGFEPLAFLKEHGVHV